MPVDEQPVAMAAEPFASLSKLRAEHVEMMREARRDGRHDEMVRRVRSFIDRVKAAGARIDSPADRDSAQDIITYWASYLFTAGDGEALSAALPILDPFDPANAPDLARQASPYQGLSAFGGDDAGRFFGREDAIKTLIDKLHDQPTVLVIGPTGSGKTSMVAAGIVPRLKSRLLIEDKNPLILTVHPGGDPFAALLKSVHDAAAGHSLPELRTWISERKKQLQRAPEQLRALLEAIFPGRPLILVVDDFEQIFTVCTDPEVKEQFAQALIDVCSDARVPDRAILIIDEQYELMALQLAPFKSLAENAAGRFVLPPLTAAEAQRVIEGTAATVGLKFDEGIVEDLAKDVAGDARALPTLQFTLTKLWNERQRNRITWDAYRKVGKPRQALERTAHAVFEGLSSDEQQIAKRLSLELVQPTSEGNFIRRRIRRDVLAQIDSPDRVSRVLTRYVEAGLIRQTAGVGRDDDRFDVPHEALATSWPLLRDWLQRERVESEKKLQLVALARRWQESGFNPGYLLSGSALEEAGAYTEAAPELKLLVTVSRDEGRRSRRRARVRRAVTSVIVVLAIAALSFAAFALWEAKTARQSLERAQKSEESALRAVWDLLGVVYFHDKGTGILPIITTRELITMAQAILQSLEERSGLDTARVEILTKLSDAYRAAGNREQALKHVKRARDIAEHFDKENSSNEKGQHLRYEIAFRIGDLLAEIDPEARDPRTKQQYDYALQIAEKRASAKPSDDAWQLRVAFIENKIGDIFSSQKNCEQSLKWYTKSLAITEQLSRADPERPDWRSHEADAHQRIGELSADHKCSGDARGAYRIALEIRKDLVDKHPQNRVYQHNLSDSYRSIGNLDKDEGDLEQAVKQYQAALDITDDLTKYDPDNVQWKIRRARLNVTIADTRVRAFVDQSQFDTALKEYDVALQIGNELAEKYPDSRDHRRELAAAYERKGDALKARGESLNSQDDRRWALETYRRGLASIKEFMQKVPTSGLEGAHDSLLEKIQSLESDLP